MAQSLDIYIDTSSGVLVARGAAKNGTLPTLTRNDSYNLRVRLQERDQNGFFRDLDTAGSSVKLGIGGIDGDPTDGQFKLVLNSVTSTAISFNATTTQVYNAISAIASASVGVATYGNENFAYLITSATLNTAMSFGGDAFTLFPTSSVLVSTRRFPTSSVAAQQVIRLVRNPAVFSDTFVASPTAGVVSLTKVQDGSSTQNETYDLAVGSDAEGGSVVLNFGANSTTAIPIGATAATFQEALTSITAIGTGNVSVDAGNNAGNYSISFVRNLGLQNLTTTFSLDASGVIFGNFLQTTVTMATAELDELFAETGADTISPKIEVELTQGGTPKTVLQTDVTVRRDLITTGSAVPAAQAQYYTKAETDALFVEDSDTNVDATNRTLFDSSGEAAYDYNARLLGNASSQQVIDHSAGLAHANVPLGFYGTTITAQPANINVVSGLINVGLIANGATYGVLPQSPRTLTTTASIAFGTLSGHAVSAGNVTVTGASIGDIVLVGLPGAVSGGPVVQGVVFAANTVCMTAINGANTSKTIGTADFRITVIGY